MISYLWSAASPGEPRYSGGDGCQGQSRGVPAKDLPGALPGGSGGPLRAPSEAAG